TVFEVVWKLAAVELVQLRQGAVAVLRMQKLKEGTFQQLLRGIPQASGKGRADAFEKTVFACDAEHVQREGEEPLQILLQVQADLVRTVQGTGAPPDKGTDHENGRNGVQRGAHISGKHPPALPR